MNSGVIERVIKITITAISDGWNRTVEQFMKPKHIINANVAKIGIQLNPPYRAK